MAELINGNKGCEAPRIANERASKCLESYPFPTLSISAALPVQDLSNSTNSLAEIIGTYRCSPRLQQCKPNMISYLSQVLASDLGFDRFKFEGSGDNATVVSVPGTGLAIRFGEYGEDFLRPNMSEVLRRLDLFNVYDTQNYFDSSGSFSIGVFPLGVCDVSKREVNSLARSLKCRGYFWREAREENAVRLKNGICYIADASSIYRVSEIGRPIFPGRFECPEPCDEYPMFDFLRGIAQLPLVGRTGALLQRLTFSSRQLLHLRPPWQSWNNSDQLCGVSDEFRPESAWHRESIQRREVRQSQEEQHLARFVEQRRIDKRVIGQLASHQANRNEDSSWTQNWRNAEISLIEFGSTMPTADWFSLSEGQRFDAALEKLENIR